MKVVKVAVEDRFNTKEVNPPRRERFDPKSSPTGEVNAFLPIVFTCGKCGYKVQFTSADFMQNAMKSKSQLKNEHAVVFDKYNGKYMKKRESFLDFYCPKCKIPVRVYFRTGVGGYHGDSVHMIDHIVEGVGEK